MCVISSLLKHVSKVKSVYVAGRLPVFQHLTMQLQKMLRELESQSFVVLYSLSRGPILCGPVRPFAVFLDVLCSLWSLAVFSITPNKLILLTLWI